MAGQQQQQHVVTLTEDVLEMSEQAARRTRMIAITPLSEFADSPPDIFQCKRRADRFNVRGTFELVDPDRVNLCIDSPWGKYFPQNRGRYVCNITTCSVHLAIVIIYDGYLIIVVKTGIVR